MEATICWVCCDKLDFYAVGNCGHIDMCLKCACRLRILKNDFKCPICKQELPKILITQDPNARLEDFPSNLPELKAGILCSQPAAKSAYQDVTDYKCWYQKCKNRFRPFNTFNQLKQHILKYHRRVFCDICMNSRVVFHWEHVLLQRNQMENHFKKGCGAQIPPHPLCLFCKQRFFDVAELKSHLQSSHFFCHFCDDGNNLYYENERVLKTHFQKAHYICHDPVCQMDKFSVFKTHIDLLLHHQNVHMNNPRGQITIPLEKLQEEIQKNTQGVDFTYQFNLVAMEETEEPQPKKKRYVIKKKQPDFINYRNLIKKSEKEVIQEIKSALEFDQQRFSILKQSIIRYIKDTGSADELLNTFDFLLGEIHTQSLFPYLITTINKPQKQDQLQTAYENLLQSRKNMTKEGQIHNEFSGCKSDQDFIKTLRDITKQELLKRKTRQIFIQENHLKQMAAIIDRLPSQSLKSLNLIMNFGLLDQNKKLVLQMIEKATDSSFVLGLTVKYQQFFLSQIQSQQLYIIHKYTDMALAKVKGLPFREEQHYLTNWKFDDQQEKETQTGWEQVLMNTRSNVPNNSETEFPSLLGGQTVAVKLEWGKPQEEKVPVVKQKPSIVQDFPTFDSFPALAKKPIAKKDPEIQEIPKEESNIEFLRKQGFAVVVEKPKKGRRRRN